MLIDFHTHIFPDRIAEKTIKSLGRLAGVQAATDSPWSNVMVGIEYINNLSISGEAKKQILGKNAIRLLNI